MGEAKTSVGSRGFHLPGALCMCVSPQVRHACRKEKQRHVALMRRRPGERTSTQPRDVGNTPQDGKQHSTHSHTHTHTHTHTNIPLARNAKYVLRFDCSSNMQEAEIRSQNRAAAIMISTCFHSLCWRRSDLELLLSTF